MSQIKLLHSGGNGVSIVAPDSNPASDRTLKLPSDGDGTILTSNSSVGKILQVVQGGSNTASSASVASKATQDTGIQVSITPSSASSKILVIATISGSASANINNWAMTLQKKTGSGSFANLTAANGAADGNRYLSISGTYMDNIYSMYNVGFNFLDTAGSTDTLIYRAAYFNSSGSTRTLYINRSSQDTNNNDYTRGASWIQALEVAA
tara:strand:- start:11 stop:637 length:627 start_codon:yes stop_codon:yes gene_type:complete